MILTCLFYLFFVAIVMNYKIDKKVLKYAFVIVAIYLGIRYEYMYDYHGYYEYFLEVSDTSFNQVYNTHMEVGWYVINRLFAPIGFYGFVFVCSCIFAYGVYLCFADYISNSKYLTLVLFGLVSSPTFPVISSAQRQMLVAGLFLIVLHHFLKDRINTVKDLWARKTMLYYGVIFLCSTFHSSALFLMIVPPLMLIPKRSYVVGCALTLLVPIVIFFGDSIFPQLLNEIVEKGDSYSYLVNVDYTTDALSTSAIIMYLAQLSAIIYLYFKRNLSNNEQFVLLAYYLSLIFLISAAFTLQLFRLSFYFYPFTYIGIVMVLQRIDEKFKIPLLCLYTLWILQKAMLIFNIQPGSVEEYKTIFSLP